MNLSSFLTWVFLITNPFAAPEKQPLPPRQEDLPQADERETRDAAQGEEQEQSSWSLWKLILSISNGF